jgi:hypothetical protein
LVDSFPSWDQEEASAFNRRGTVPILPDSQRRAAGSQAGRQGTGRPQQSGDSYFEWRRERDSILDRFLKRATYSTKVPLLVPLSLAPAQPRPPQRSTISNPGMLAGAGAQLPRNLGGCRSFRDAPSMKFLPSRPLRLQSVAPCKTHTKSASPPHVCVDYVPDFEKQGN